MNAVLLTGAGFTKTFGGYLASEMWATILNQPEVQNSPELLKKMRDDLDYEMVYEVIQTRGTEQQKKDLNTAIRSAFKEMDNNIRTCKPPLPRGHSCCQFISRIVQDQTPSSKVFVNWLLSRDGQAQVQKGRKGRPRTGSNSLRIDIPKNDVPEEMQRKDNVDYFDSDDDNTADRRPADKLFNEIFGKLNK